MLFTCRFDAQTGADREVQRILLELLNQMDGFESQGQVKMVMATNRPDILDPALLRPGRLDRKIEIPEPNETQRLEILKIHAANITKRGEIDYESVVKLADGLNGADMRNVCTEAGLFAIRSDRDAEPVLIWPVPRATAKSAIVESSVSPLRWLEILV